MDSYMASIMTFAFNWTPMYFAACNGQLMQIQQNSALYALLGVQFGGNGSTNFNLPDLQGRAPVHFGTASGGSTNRVFAGKFGQDNMTLTQTQLPTHGHTVQEVQAGQTVTATATAVANASSAQGGVNPPTNGYWAKGWNAAASQLVSCYNSTKTAGITMASDAVQVTVTPTFTASNLATGAAGAGAGFSLTQPSLALNFCICTAGIFPSRT